LSSVLISPPFPTAFDLAKGITFSSDVDLGGCAKDARPEDCDPHEPRTWPTHHAPSMTGISKAVRMFHTQMLMCLAAQKPDECGQSLTLDSFLHNRGVATMY
jgi:hypothetical protein